MLWKCATVLIRQQISKREKKGWQAGTRDKMANLETSSIVRKTHLETNQNCLWIWLVERKEVELEEISADSGQKNT